MKLTNKQIKRVNELYTDIYHTIDGSSAVHNYGRAVKEFKMDRNVTSSELKLIILKNMVQYETEDRNNPLHERIMIDYGLLGILGIYERLRDKLKYFIMLHSVEIMELYNAFRAN